MVKVMRLAFAILTIVFFSTSVIHAQQTLGSINGTVTDSSGGVISGASVKARNIGTNLEQTAKSKSDGSFSIADLPIGTYEVSFSKDGFKTEVHSQIFVQGDRTTTVNSSLQPGEVSSQVTVTATPLLNQTDTTNGYILGSELIQATPLGTGSFTQLAILSLGVSADPLNGSGSSGAWEPGHFCKRPAGYQQQFQLQRSQCEQFVQREIDEPGFGKPFRVEHGAKYDCWR